MKQDVIIIGAGPAGLSFARELAHTNLNIVLIEKQTEEILQNPPYDGREIALTHLSHRIMNSLGMWQLIPDAKISRIKAAKVLNGKSPYALSFDQKETEKGSLGFMISNNEIRKAAYESLAGFKNVQILSQKEVSKLGTDSENGWVEMQDGERLEASLIVAADSRFSETRSKMGISTSLLDFGRTCIVCTMNTELCHKDTAYECFHYDRTLAVLPLSNNSVSIVITLKSEESAGVLSMSREELAADVERRIERRFGTMELTSELFPYPLVATFAKTFCSNRFAVIGDAAVGMHPVTAHGFNLGLRSAHTLAGEIKAALEAGGDFSNQTVLESYSSKHRRDSLPIYKGTNALVKLYTKDTPPAKFVRRALLHLGNHVRPAKRLILKQLTENTAA